MLKSIIANLKPCKRAHYFVYATYESAFYATFEALALDGTMCQFWHEDSKGTTFKIDLAYSAN